jgi:hypothetical protein
MNLDKRKISEIIYNDPEYYKTVDEDDFEYRIYQSLIKSKKYQNTPKYIIYYIEANEHTSSTFASIEGMVHWATCNNKLEILVVNNIKKPEDDYKYSYSDSCVELYKNGTLIGKTIKRNNITNWTWVN